MKKKILFISLVSLFISATTNNSWGQEIEVLDNQKIKGFNSPDESYINPKKTFSKSFIICKNR